MWRFVHLSDLHLASQRDGQWNNRFLCTMMPDVMSCLRRDLAGLEPDFLLVTGDICSTQTRDAMFAARDLMDSLEVPYYPMGGNHDFPLKESRAWFIEAFQEHLPIDDTVYSFTHKNLHFCVLDPWWKWFDGSLCPFREKSPEEADLMKHESWALPPHQIAWLDDDLQKHRDVPTIIAMHYPALPIPQHMRRPGFMDAGQLDNGDMLLEFLRDHGQVKAIFSGHVHMHFRAVHGRLTQVVTGAMPEYPTEFRDIQVFDDHLEINTLSLSDGSFAAQSLIPGKDWTCGREDDRVLSIDLA